MAQFSDGTQESAHTRLSQQLNELGIETTRTAEIACALDRSLRHEEPIPKDIPETDPGAPFAEGRLLPQIENVVRYALARIAEANETIESLRKYVG